MKYVVTLNGKNYEVDVTETDAVITSVSSAPAAAAAPVAAPAAAAVPVNTAVSADGTKVNAPMPGNILAVNFTAGQSVKEGDVMFILEAMKMENEIVAPSDGTVASVNVSQGQSVNSGDLLVSLS